MAENHQLGLPLEFLTAQMQQNPQSRAERQVDESESEHRGILPDRAQVPTRSESEFWHPTVSVERLITTRQLADLWCQSPRWVLRMAGEHGLPHFVLGGALRYRISEVEAWLQQHHAGQAIDSPLGPSTTASPGSVALRPVADALGAA